MNKSRLLNLCLLAGLAGSLTFGFITLNNNALLTEKNVELTTENQSLNTKLEVNKKASDYTINTLEGKVTNLQSLVSNKNQQIEKLTNQLDAVKATAQTLLDELKLNNQVMEAYSNTLEKANDTISSLKQQITTLDESIADFASEITNVRKELREMIQEYSAAVYAVFQYDHLNKGLTIKTAKLEAYIKELLKTNEALIGYLSFYEKNSVVLKQNTCISQTKKLDETTLIPYRECDAEILVEGQKINLNIELSPKQKDNTSDPAHQYLSKLVKIN